MKKVGIIIIIFLAVFLLVALVVPSIGRLPWTDNVNVTEVPKVNVKKYLIATSKFKSYKQNYTLQELKESKLAVMQQDIDLLPQAFTELKPTLITETDLKKSLIEDYIVLLNPDSVDFTMKSLIIDGIDYWDKEADLTNYPLQIEVEIEASEAAKSFLQ